MNNDMKARVISLLESYPVRERQIALLHYEMQHPSRITPDEMIDGMSLSHGDNPGGSGKGHISNKTMYIALNYQERMDRMNTEAANEIAQRLLELEAEQARLKEQAEAERQEAAKQEDLAARLGHSLESETLFEAAFMEWLKLYKSPPTRKPSTYASYLATYETHFAPAFGKLPLYEITQDVIQDYYQKKQLKGGRQDGKEGGLSPKTIRKDFFTYSDLDLKRQTLSINKNMLRVETAALSLDNPTIRILNYDPAERCL